MFTGLSRFILHLFPGSTSLGSASSIQAAVRQLEAEADAIIQMVREGQRARRLQQAPPPSSSASSSAAVAAAAAAASAAVAVAGSSAPSTSATNNPPAGTASAATVSMGRTDSRQTATDCTHPHTPPMMFIILCVFHSEDISQPRTPLTYFSQQSYTLFGCNTALHTGHGDIAKNLDFSHPFNYAICISYVKNTVKIVSFLTK